MTSAVSNLVDINTLIEDCRNGDQSAFKAIYDLYSTQMFSICFRIVNNRELAEDILQESFFTAFSKINQFKDQGSFGSWLKRIVVNNSLDVVKKNKIQFIEIEKVEFAEENTKEPNWTIYDLSSINKAMEALPDGYRIILTLYLFEEQSHKEISEQLGISIGTSKSQYMRGRMKLAEILAKNIEL